MKILVLKPRVMNYRHIGFTDFRLSLLHRELFAPRQGQKITEADLPWWLQPDKPAVITDPARLLEDGKR